MKHELKDDSQIIATAILRASDLMGITLKDLAAVLLVSQNELSQLLKTGIEPDSETGKRSISFINVYKRLASLCGNDEKFMAHYLGTMNKYFKAYPIDVMKTQPGLEEVHHYLIAMGSKH